MMKLRMQCYMVIWEWHCTRKMFGEEKAQYNCDKSNPTSDLSPVFFIGKKCYQNNS